MEDKKTYSISELSKEFEVTTRAIRLYEDNGLVLPTREGSKRIYSERERVRLRLILRGKRLGCSLSEIKEIFDLYDSDLGEEAQIHYLLGKLRERKGFLLQQQQDIERALYEIQKFEDKALKTLTRLEAESVEQAMSGK